MVKSILISSGDNIHARILLDELKKNSVSPFLIINEEGTLTAQKLGKFLKTSSFKIPSLKTFSNYLGVKQYDSHLSIETIKKVNPDYLIFGGCGEIIKSKLLDLTTPINIHPGILPEFRGLDPVLWSLYFEKNLGATVHLMEKGIDTGDIIISKVLPKRKVLNILELRLECIRWGGKLLSRFLKNPANFKFTKQNEDNASYFKSFPKDKEKTLYRKFLKYQSLL